jgi:hypothetical protein
MHHLEKRVAVPASPFGITEVVGGCIRQKRGISNIKNEENDRYHNFSYANWTINRLGRLKGEE